MQVKAYIELPCHEKETQKLSVDVVAGPGGFGGPFGGLERDVAVDMGVDRSQFRAILRDAMSGLRVKHSRRDREERGVETVEHKGVQHIQQDIHDVYSGDIDGLMMRS